jgi:hypothetical protein
MFQAKSKKVIFLNSWLVVLFSFFIAGCTSAWGKSSKTTVGYDDEPTIMLSSVDDPDGDGDSKGANYFPLVRKATGNKVFIFDPNYVAWAIYDENGNRQNAGKASGGKLYCPDINRRCTTIAGEFKIISKGGPDCVSTRYPVETNGGAPMPYCMHFSSKGYAIHGSNDVPPDRNASHGCIRITPIAAKWLNKTFMEVGTTVIIYPYK